MKYASQIKGLVLDAIRSLYPFLVCAVSAQMISITWSEVGSTSARLAFTVVGMLGFVWALDLAETKGYSRGTAKYASLFLDFITSANDKEIIITHRTEDRQGASE
ncbi:hypothetical protein [Chelativorans sp. Marseille-P2723]|uniref:hypothetical protein n=1 Tax=Chelativorans sp. Marseille-P2723 TaxID=2709133 RepID=UPI00156DCBAE|nr:hypothetical protein [Chelativorans sp. Marseille-P2723]